MWHIPIQSGREGKGIQAWSTYRLSPKSTIQVEYRNAYAAKDFFEGGTLQDLVSAPTSLVRRELGATSRVLAPGAQSNVTTSGQFTFWPHQ